ncbi:mRNA binding protein puf3 [Serendipita sp. 396]|nr:mRNA binding protein puf3 [Serendipita sp. 396]
MSTKRLPSSHSASHSPVGSPGSSSRTHRKLASSSSPNPFDLAGAPTKRKSLQGSEAPYIGSNWTGSAYIREWNSTTPDGWSIGAANADVTGHRSLMSKTTENIVHDEDHLHPSAAFEEHKYSPASSARNSVQSAPITTPSLMGSVDSTHDHTESMIEPTADGSRSYIPPSNLQGIVGGFHHHHGNSHSYPHLTIQTNGLPQSHSPPGTFGAHYQTNSRGGYPHSRDYRYSYEQMSYSSPTQPMPPHSVFSPVLAHQPHSSVHDYFRRPPGHVYYSEYVTSPTIAAMPAPAAGYYYATPPQPVSWNGPAHTPVSNHHPSPLTVLSHVGRQSNTQHVHSVPQASVVHPPVPMIGGGMQPYPSAADPAKAMPTKSVTLPARGRPSLSTRITPAANISHQTTHVVTRHARREQRDSIPTHRSAILEDFRNNRNKRWDLQDIAGHVLEFSSDQHGSRFIQHKLTTANELSRSIVYRELIPTNILRLARDVFGNYVLQKLCELGTPEERATVARTLQGHIVPLSLDMYGCRVLQRMIDYLNAEEQARWVDELNGHILQCVKDSNGNHVIQKFLESPLSDKSIFILTFKGHVYEMATHPHGCRVLQRCFEHVKPELTRVLLNEMHLRTLGLMQDQYGNYVCQFILEKGSAYDRNRVIDTLTGSMLPMSKHKFASNVCEKAIINSSPEQRRTLIEEISLQRPDGMNPMVTMIKDQYANYVLQRALEIAEGPAMEGLVNALRPQLFNMQKLPASSPFSKHIIAVERILRERHIDINSREPLPRTSSDKSDSSSTPTAEKKPPGLQTTT